ncbi:hypothetical protein ABZ470_31720 [Streptosporangium sp. NPDC020072]|uniref:hypothetical protein n=1 Tax=Streptosporangium sp. NPDC020072 TaxID=3154788 RepID=UPI0034172EEC
MDFYRGRVSLRRLLVVINRLLQMHGRSALAVALLGDVALWSNTDYLIADAIDRIEVTNWLLVEINKSEGTNNPFPDPYPRPGYVAPSEKEVAQSFASAHEIHGVLAGLAVP